MNPGAGNQYFPYEMGQKYPQYPPGWIYPLPSTYNFNDRGTPSPSPSTASSGSSESFPFVEDGSMPESSQTSSRRTSSENKKAQERWTKDEEKLLVQLWAEKHDQLESRVQENVGLDRREDFGRGTVQQDGRQIYSENEVHHRKIQECKRLELKPNRRKP